MSLRILSPVCSLRLVGALVCVVILVLWSNAACAATGKVTVNLAAVMLSRAQIFALDKTPYAAVLKHKVGLFVTLQIISKALGHPTLLESVNIKAAILSNGVSVKYLPPATGFPRSLDTPMARAMRQAGELGFPVTLRFDMPPPGKNSPAKLGLLKGSLVVQAGGTPQAASLANPLAAVGHHMHSAALAGLGLTVRVLSYDKHADGSHDLTLSVRGPTGVFKSVRVMAGRQLISEGYIDNHMQPGLHRITIPLRLPLNAKTVLVVQGLAGQKEFRIPFKLLGIPLPR
ncbi:MAG: hypothetical protein HKL96_13735 [Phycisphaerales bacterium]|nr:hypothetical protein [Phycisphaerales bacterium]